MSLSNGKDTLDGTGTRLRHRGGRLPGVAPARGQLQPANGR